MIVMTKNKCWGVVAVSVIVLLILSPVIDQYLAAAGYNIGTRTFYGEQSIWCSFIYHLVPVITIMLILWPLIWLFIVRNNYEKRGKVIKFGIMLYMALSIGPGLVVNVVFKDHWGRPRPYQVLRDGKEYTPFWVPHFSQTKDNSFPGGHASIGFFIGVPFLLLGYRKAAVIISAAGGAVVGGVRILQGGHYFSDVLFSGIFVWLVAWCIVYILGKEKASE